jgi:hypothetical protein
MTTHIDEKDGTIRQDHYGEKRQPWDDIVDQGWAVGFAAGNIPKYLRRDKAKDHSLTSASWYWERLHEFVKNNDPAYAMSAEIAILCLKKLLTEEELKLLTL